MNRALTLFCLVLCITSCDERSQTISHDDTITTEIKKDSSKIEIADLPILIDSTDYLIHPIGYVTEYNNSRFSSYSKGSGRTSYAVSHYNNFSISGELSNIKFQHLNSEKITALTDELIEITSIRFLETIRAQNGLQFLVYTIRDADTNKDTKLNSNDIETLYISTISGKGLKKLTPELAQIVDWNVIPQQSRLYFKSISDTNKNGEFDKNDRVNYQYVNLEDEHLNVIHYNPL
ncbi:hypothetical protein [Winogradskyella helgolandensis]|uniref:hypothetical protein n=1 Tax=Winogradskyella helgolandensis TaxID=2697010 RepID=UPI0015BA2661|nr:hypothetical protein [Winogradskyella helgolandensis]